MKPLLALLGLLVAISPAQGQTAADSGAQTAADSERLYSQEQLTVVPVVLRQPTLVYPDSLKRSGIGGTVRVSVVVNWKGHPESTSVRVLSSPDTGLNAAARAVVLGTVFTEGRVGNRDVRTLLTLPIVFDPLDTARAPSPIYSMFDSLTEPPKQLVLGRLVYPPGLHLRCVQGRVVTQVIIDTLGRPEPASIQFVALPDSGFKLPVSEYLASSLFRPARRDGRPVRSIVYLPVGFYLPSPPCKRFAPH